MQIARTFKENEKIKIEKLRDTVFTYEKVRNEFYGLLQLKKYTNSLPKEYQKKITGKGELETLIDEIDPTVTRFEDVLNKIDNTKAIDEMLYKKKQKKKGLEL